MNFDFVSLKSMFIPPTYDIKQVSLPACSPVCIQKFGISLISASCLSCSCIYAVYMPTHQFFLLISSVSIEIRCICSIVSICASPHALTTFFFEAKTKKKLFVLFNKWLMWIDLRPTGRLHFQSNTCLFLLFFFFLFISNSKKYVFFLKKLITKNSNENWSIPSTNSISNRSKKLKT